jgi:predicted glycoside hydrolase/deacetylase ChbG (UPF0249 family)
MTALIVQADDNAISRATALGILDSINHGIVRNTGMFSNMPAFDDAAQSLKDNLNVCVGLDINFVTGRPISSPEVVPSLVDRLGRFRPSGEIRSSNKLLAQDGLISTFESEPFPFAEILLEGRAQVERFVHVFGRPPAYLHHHALATPTTDRVILELAAELRVPVPMAVSGRPGVHFLPNSWYTSPFPIEAQADSDPLSSVLDALPGLLQYDLGILITHPGYVDADLLELSSFTVIRARDLQMLQSPEILTAIADLGIDLITWNDLPSEFG